MQKQYGDHTITLTDEMQFEVSGPLFLKEYRVSKIFPTYQSACDKIDGREKAQEKQARTKLSLAVLNESGEPVTITGVHGRNLNALGVGDASEVWPPEQWIADLLKEKRRLVSRNKTVLDILSRYAIKTSRPYYGDRVDYEQVVEFFQKQVSEKSSAAASPTALGRPNLAKVS